MKIAGFQPLSLLDYPEHVAAIVFTQGCPFRCAYCHNPELLTTQAPSALGADEVLAALATRRDMLDGVVVTGGEPTIHPELPAFLAAIKRLGLRVKLDTNGTHPRAVQSMIADGLLDYIAMDLKHRWESYDVVARTGNPRIGEHCRKTFQIIQHSGVMHEFRTTVCPGLHTAEDVLAIAGYLQSGERYVLQPMRSGKMLEPEAVRGSVIDIKETVSRMRQRFPHLDVHIRS